MRGCACRGTAGFAHVSCLAEQAKILVAEAEENNLGDKVKNERWRGGTCSLCEQKYHGVVACALGWACWKTYVGGGWRRTGLGRLSMTVLGNGLGAAEHHEDALSVKRGRVVYGAAPWRIRRQHRLIAQRQSCDDVYKARTGQEALQMKRDVYSGRLKLNGEEHGKTLIAANNYAQSLSISSASRKPSHCCAKRCPWRDAFSARVMRSRSR